MNDSSDGKRPPFRRLALTRDERRQIERQLALAFGLTPAAARAWVEVTARRGECYGRVVPHVRRTGASAQEAGKRPNAPDREGVEGGEGDGLARAGDGRLIAASYAAEPLPLVRGAERRMSVMLQSYYVHPRFRGQGFGLTGHDVDALRRRFAADVVVLTLFEEGLAEYWRQRGFEVVQRAGEVELAEYLARTRLAFTPAPDDEAVTAKVAEVTADGATVSEADGLLAVSYAGETAIDELLVRDARRAELAVTSGRAGHAARRVRLKTVMASPGDIELLCAIDL